MNKNLIAPSIESYHNFLAHDLGDGLRIHTGNLPTEFVWRDATLEAIWSMQPAHREKFRIFGTETELPRGMLAFGANYRFSGDDHLAQPVPNLLEPLLHWAKQEIFPGFNGVLVNFYGPKDYIGPHRDSVQGMVRGAPIVTVSFGEERVFRLSQSTTKESRDFTTPHGTVFILPYQTNQVWKHSVPRAARFRSRRISVTLRAFTEGIVDQ